MSLLHLPSEFIEWVGLESHGGLSGGATITDGASGSAGQHIVYIDFNHVVDIEVASADTIQIHNAQTVTQAGNVTLVW